MEQQELIEILKNNLSEGKLPCAAAFQISKKFNVNLKRIGKTANEAKIKISNCQLGCFT